MRFLIAGLGSIGRRHLRNLTALGERDIILLRSRRSTLPEADLAGFPVETDLAAALAKRPDAVVVANPTALHLDVAIPAAEAGCHLLMEKPISHSTDRVADLRAAAQRGGSRILVGFQFRFHPALQDAARLLGEGAIGRPVSACARWGEYLPGWHPWEDYRSGYAARADLGGGVVLTLCHPIDYLQWLLGPATLAFARVATMGDLGLAVDDVADLGLQFRNGALGSVHLNYLQRPGSHCIEIVGTEGTLRWDQSDGRLQLYRAERGAWEVFPLPEGFERNTMFLGEMRHFLDVVQGRAAPCCTLDDGARTLDLAMQALGTMRTGSEEHE